MTFSNDPDSGFFIFSRHTFFFHYKKKEVSSIDLGKRRCVVNLFDEYDPRNNNAMIIGGCVKNATLFRITLTRLRCERKHIFGIGI